MKKMDSYNASPSWPPNGHPPKRAYKVYVDGFPDAHCVLAETIAKAKYASFLAYDEAGYGGRGSKRGRWLAFSMNAVVCRDYARKVI